MAFYTQAELESMGFRHLGENTQVSTKCSIYYPNLISLGDGCRVDDFVMLAGSICTGRNVHITAYCNIEGGRSGVKIGNFATLAYGCHIIAQSDDYSGESMTNSTIPSRFKIEDSREVSIGDYSILGAGTIVLPGVELPEGVASGAQTLFTKSVEPWGLYVGSPAQRIKDRSKKMLELTQHFLSDD